uniref:Uncharacterized protein n=1 Tax=viral metagenome TaxID=1070528 RepID=A0A6C0KQ50_9ZZZZ
MTTNETEEKAYMAKSLNFINTYIKYFTPELSSVVSKMNANEELMNAMKEIQGSNLKKLIDVITPHDNNLNVKIYKKKDGSIDHSTYVTESIKFIVSTDSKDKIYNELIGFINDMKANPKFMGLVKTFKEDKTEWKKMVGMLIPEGSTVKLVIDQFERTSSDLNLLYWNDIFRKNAGKDIICTVSKRGLLKRDMLVFKKFKKQVMLPEEILFKKNRVANSEVPPEAIELINQEEGSGTVVAGEGTAPVASAVSVDDAAVVATALVSVPAAASVPAVPVDDESEEASGSGTPSQQQPAVTSGTAQQSSTAVDKSAIGPEGVQVNVTGGQQRTTRKHKNSIIGSARKTRTYR